MVYINKEINSINKRIDIQNLSKIYTYKYLLHFNRYKKNTNLGNSNSSISATYD